MNLAGKTVLITGSSIGIGRETAFQFAKHGCTVILTYYTNRKEALAAAKQCRKLGALDVLVLPLDVMRDASIKACIKNAVKAFDHIDILVNNAGVIVWKRFAGQTFKDIKRQARTNLEGPMKMTLAALPHVRDAIVNLASLAGVKPYKMLVPYCATKFGVRGFTQALAKEQSRLKVYAINPGLTATRMTGFKGVPASKVAEIIVHAVKGGFKTPSGGDVNVWQLL